MEDPPKRKGLNVPNKKRKNPLDLEFEKLAVFLEIDEDSENDILTQYCLKGGDNQVDVEDSAKIEYLIAKSFEFIFEIQRLSKIAKEKNETDSEKANLISISLHDLKYLNELTNFIILQLISPLLPIDIGLPLNQRRLKSFNEKSKKFQFRRQRTGKNNELLLNIISNFETLFSRQDDIRDLLIKGTGLIDIITCLIVLIHANPNDQGITKKYEYFESQSDTYNLYSIYTLLLQSTTNPKYKQFLSLRLSHTTITRPNGVISLIDFIVGIRDDEDINIEKFNHVNKVLLAVPKSISKVVYFKSIFSQIYGILVFVDRPVLLSVALNFISRVYELNKRIIHDFLFSLIWENLDRQPGKNGDGNVIVTEKQLNDVINVLISLTKESSGEFLNELFSKIFLNLWSYFNYLRKKKLDYNKIVLKIMTSFFKITKNNDFLKDIILNLVRFEIRDGLEFVTTLENNLTSIRTKNGLLNEEKYTNEDFFNDIELCIDSLIELLKEVDDKDLVREQFLIVLNRWILQKKEVQSFDYALNEENPFLILIDLKLLEKINETFRDSLLDKPEDVLLMIKNILLVKSKSQSSDDDLLAKESPDEVDSDDEDSDDDLDVGNEGEDSDNLGVLLELLSAIISETNPVILKSKHEATLSEISNLLLNFQSNKYCASLSSRIKQLLQNEAIEDETLENDEITKDKETLENALTNMNDPLVPIRAHGLHLLRQLIVKKSEILSVSNVIELHLAQLHDTEPFIYLNVIKSLNELLELNETDTLKVLIDYYFNNIKDQENNLDDRLKIGEVLLNFIQRKNELLVSNPLIDELISNTIHLINEFESDNKLRMSAMSILGESLKINARGLEKFIKDSIDCSIGILELEKDITMKRSAVVLINDLVCNDIELIPRGYGDKIRTLLRYVKLNSEDYLLIEQIDKSLENITEAVQERLKVDTEMPSQFKSFKI